MFDAISIGELLIDFTPNGYGSNRNPCYEQNPGGAPANVVAGMAKFGLQTSFIGKVGNDSFGLFLKKTLEDCGVNTSGLIIDEKNPTTLAFVHIGSDGNRHFSFVRNNSADVNLDAEDIQLNMIEDCTLVHFGSVSLTHEKIRLATMRAIDYAQSKGKLISFDPNYRKFLWDNEICAKQVILSALTYPQIVKLSEEELFFLTDATDLEYGIRKIVSKYTIPLLAVTLDEKGCIYCFKGNIKKINTISVNVVDTSGAGDSFLSGLLYCVLKGNKNLMEYGENEMEYFIKFANVSGSLTTTQKGAIPSMPKIDDVLSGLENHEFHIC